ncbi:apolipoprotein C-II-like isoform X1 [Huso huso]|uniref:Apolipoprotein C-II n=1 Tax=Huso huso TaxID=61971 RepID=A0ABR0YAU3_HUSHU
MKLITVAVLLAVFCYGVESFRLQKRDAEPTAPPSAWGNVVTDTLWDYWGKGTALASGWIEDVKSWKVDEKVRNLYTESATAIETYTGILKDQIYHSWNQQ